MVMTRRALGNSSTAQQQLAAQAVIGEAGNQYTGGHLPTGSAILAAAAAKGKRKVDERVLRRVAEKLMSNDPKQMKLLAEQAARSPAYMDVIRSLDNAAYGLVSATGRGVSQAVRGSPRAAGLQNAANLNFLGGMSRSAAQPAEEE